MLQLFPGYLKGEDLFGLTVSAVARIAESVSLRHPGSCWVTPNCWIWAWGGEQEEVWKSNISLDTINGSLLGIFCSFCLFSCSCRGLRPVRTTLSAMAETP